MEGEITPANLKIMSSNNHLAEIHASSSQNPENVDLNSKNSWIHGKWIDVTLPIHENMIVWPEDPSVQVLRVSDVEKGDSCTVSQISMSSHTGTHLDAPSHFIRGGKDVDELDLNVLNGPCVVLNAEKDELDEDTLKLLTQQAPERILFKTRNSERKILEGIKFDTRFQAINSRIANQLLQLLPNLKLVGIDAWSIESFQDSSNDAPVHKLLLSRDIVILEGVNLANIQPGEYNLACFPLKIKHGDGSPCRVALCK